MKKPRRLEPPNADGHSPELTRYLGRWWIPGVTPGRGAEGWRRRLKRISPEEFRENQRVLAWALITGGFLALLAGMAFNGPTDWALLAPFSVALAVGGGVILVRTRPPTD